MIEFIKNLNFEKIKPVIIAAVCLIAVFAAGFGVGRSNTASPVKRSTNYTTNTSPQAKTEPKKPDAPTGTTATTDCYIKGSKSKIYHLPGGSFYERTNATQCFASESEAQAAGYTKSSR